MERSRRLDARKVDRVVATERIAHLTRGRRSGTVAFRVQSVRFGFGSAPSRGGPHVALSRYRGTNRYSAASRTHRALVAGHVPDRRGLLFNTRLPTWDCVPRGRFPVSDR